MTQKKSDCINCEGIYYLVCIQCIGQPKKRQFVQKVVINGAVEP